MRATGSYDLGTCRAPLGRSRGELFMRKQHRRSLVRDQRGLSTVEYTVLLVLIVACAVGMWNRLGGQVTERITGASDQLDDQVKVPGAP
jgi:Flp pilus assembly pilin Flp